MCSEAVEVSISRYSCQTGAVALPVEDKLTNRSVSQCGLFHSTDQSERFKMSRKRRCDPYIHSKVLTPPTTDTSEKYENESPTRLNGFTC